MIDPYTLVETVPAQTLFQENTQQFIDIPEFKLILKHSLSSISKWESRWHKPFLSGLEDMPLEETIDYIKCMTLNDVPDEYYNYIPSEAMQKIAEYMNDPMTASWINDHGSGKTDNRPVTSEILYSQMFELHIPLECENWHLQKLIMQIRISAERQTPPEKMTEKETREYQNEIKRKHRAEIKRQKELMNKK